MQALVLLVGLAFKDINDLSVFPLAPIEILWVIMITYVRPSFILEGMLKLRFDVCSSSFPAMGLGAEKASPDVLRRKPHDVRPLRRRPQKWQAC
jgi:Na+-exporting ATPase